MDPQPSPARQAPTFVWVAVLIGVVVLAAQAVLLFVVLDTRSSISALQEDVGDVELRLASGTSPDPAPEATTTSTATVAAPATEAPPETTGPATTVGEQALDLPSSPAPELSTDASGLPALVDNVSADPAVGAQLGDLGGNEWAAGQELVVDLADGKARAVVVWAHWCPSCQELLPQLADWQEATGASLENMELVTIASATDGESDQTLPEYLSDQDFPFPVILDSNNELAARLGVSAFPFWVFVSPEGRVIGRVAGQLPPEQFATLFSDLEEIATADG